MLALAQACSRGVNMAPKIHDLRSLPARPTATFLGAFARALIVKKFLTQRRNGAKEETELFLFTENQKTGQVCSVETLGCAVIR